MIPRTAFGCLSIALTACTTARFSAPPPATEPGRPTGSVETSPSDRGALEPIRSSIDAGDREGARAILLKAVAELQPAPPGEERARLAFLIELAGIADELEALAEKRGLRETMLDLGRRILPEDSAEVLALKQDLAVARGEVGDLEGARALEEEVVATRSRLLPADDPDLLSAKQNLAVTVSELGDFERARALQQEVLEARTRTLPPDHPDLLEMKHNQAATLFQMRDLEGARAMLEDVLSVWTRTLPADHPAVLTAKLNLAATLAELDDPAGARDLEEEVYAAWSRLLPADHPDLLAVKENLGATRMELGDLAGARALQEEVLEARTRLLPPDHPRVLAAKLNLGRTRKELGDLDGARELEEAVVGARSRLLPDDHPDLLKAKGNLAITRTMLGDLDGARALEEEVLAARARTLPDGHPDLVKAKGNLANVRQELGDLDGARKLEEEVLAAWQRFLPSGHPDLLTATQGLAVTMSELGDFARTRELVGSLLQGMRVRARELRSEAERSAREGARSELQRLSEALSLALVADPGKALDPQLFATLEDLRLTSVVSSEAARALKLHPELAPSARAIAALRSRLNDLVAGGAREGQSIDAWRKDLLALTEERDHAERELRSRLAQTGLFTGEVDCAAVGNALAPESAAVSFLRYPRHSPRDPATRDAPPSVDSLLAFVVRPGGTLRRVELGPADEVEGIVREWRQAVGRTVRGRGLGVAEAQDAHESLESLGRRLRERILDPILAEAPAARTLDIVPDDVLHLVPFDALPLENGLVGERIRVRTEVTLARILRPDAASDIEGVAGVEGTLTLAGGIDYDAGGSGKDPRVVGASRAAPGLAEFEFLPETSVETRSIAAIYREAFEVEVAALTDASATKAALFAAAPRTRWLHLATHGWFAPEILRSQLDASPERGSGMRWQEAEETLAGFAPETLCGLALAGANEAPDEHGHMPGILTAEELAGFDLSNCELAVLSACETNVGVRRAGQGIQSLQSALHAAGVRTAITSLWKVDDAATRRFFEFFYAKLWKEKLPKSDALWQAKMALRNEGHPLCDWAGWLMSGEPE